MRTTLSLRQLETILAVAELHSFSAAAVRLHVSQPALSRTVRLAEESLGTRLFDRDTRSVKLTAAGAELLPIARRIVLEFSDSMSELSQFVEGRRGRIRVSALPSMARSLVADAVAAFSVEHPQVEFLLRVDSATQVLELVESRDIDLGITVQPPPDGRFAYHHLTDDAFVLVCRADDPLALKTQAGQSLGWNVFQDRRFIAATQGSNTRAATDAAFMRAGLTVRPAHEVASSNLAVIGRLIAAGLGLAVLPTSCMGCLDQPGLVSRRLVEPLMKRQVGIVTLAGRTLSLAASHFCAELRRPYETRAGDLAAAA